MRSDLAAVLERAVQDPHRLGPEVARLDDDARRALLEVAASGATSRRLFAAFGRLEPDEAPLAQEGGVTVYLGRASFPALGAFELHLFRREGQSSLWGRVVTGAGTFAGPGYCGVAPGQEPVVDFDLMPPPDDVPEGWPPVRSNGDGIAAVLFGGTQLRLRGSGSALLTGQVWRRGRDQGAFVNLVRTKRAVVQ